MHAVPSVPLPRGFDEAWTEVRDAHLRTVDEHRIAGSAVAVQCGSIEVASLYAGLADVDTGRPVDARTIFHWASITKTVTGVALMQLRDRGRLSLGDPVTAYLPELRRVHNPFGPMDAITLRHLLGHTSGFRQTTFPWGGDQPWHPFEPTSWNQIAAMLPYSEIRFEPGSRYGYSNLGFLFLGRVVEEVAGEDIEVYVDKNVFKPLGMHRSYFDRTPYHLLPFRSNSYTVGVDGIRRANGLDFDTGVTAANGGLNAPLEDMRRYLAFLAGAAESPAAAGVLARASLDEMRQRLHPVARRGACEESMGLAFHLLDGRGRRVAGHTGTQLGFVSFFYVDPATTASALAVYNTVGAYTREGPAPPDTRRLSHALRAHLLDAVFPLFDPS